LYTHPQVNAEDLYKEKKEITLNNNMGVSCGFILHGYNKF